MSYDNRITRYSFTASDIGAGTKTKYITGPKGKIGLLHDYGVEDCTTLFTNVTTGATIQVGITGTLNAYGGPLDLGALAVASGGKSVLSTVRPGVDAAYLSTYMLDRTMTADTVILVTGTAPTGGTPAGVAKMFVDIIWSD